VPPAPNPGAGGTFQRLIEQEEATPMSKTLRVALLALVCGASGVQAQTRDNAAGAGLKSACRADYRAHCTGNDPAPPIAAACLSQYYVNLSKNCQAALEAYNNPASERSDGQ